MKSFIAILTGLILVLSVSIAIAETNIIVTGSGETQVTADTAVITLGVSARDKDVLKAQQKVNTAIASIRKALSAKGVREECISTDYMNIYAIYDYTDDQEQIAAYNANSTLAIKASDIDSIGMLIDESFAAGANMLNGISFSSTNTDDAKAESLEKAVADAKAKALILAEAAGLHITGIETIKEGDIYSYDNTVGNFNAKAANSFVEDFRDAGTVVQAAKLIINATVQITFKAE